MKFIKLAGLFFTSFLFIASLAHTAQAELKGYNFFLQADGITLYTGELFIDESLNTPGQFYSFQNIIDTGGSLSITVEDTTFTIEDADDKVSEGILNGPDGQPATFHVFCCSTGFSSVPFIGLSTALIIVTDNGRWEYQLVNIGAVREGDSHSFAPIPGPEPTADAGPDQAIHGPAEVTLDGTGSFDDDTDTADLLYNWQLVTKPEGSNATLAGADTATPSFFADVLGDYIALLVVTDGSGLTSPPDTVLISSDNLAPTAAAGEDQLVVANETVFLDGSGSTDPESDPLSYAWKIIAAPNGSDASIIDADSVTPSFISDQTGQYQIELVVSDPIGPGAPDTVTITAASAEDLAEMIIVETADLIATLPKTSITKHGNRKKLGEFLAEAIAAIHEDALDDAVAYLEKARVRTDGCTLRGSADRKGPGRDWITDDPDCTAQNEVYALLTEAIDLLTF